MRALEGVLATVKNKIFKKIKFKSKVSFFGSIANKEVF